MTRRIIAILLFVFSAQLFAFEDASNIFSPTLSADPTLPQSGFGVDPKIHPIWLHHITAISSKEGMITLEDGSQFKPGSWYSGILKSWKVGDEVTVAWYPHTYFLDIQIKNHTKESYTWCRMEQTPEPNASGFRFIQSIPNRMTLVLNDGTRITTKAVWMFADFHEGDVVYTLYGKGTGTRTLYSLWDMTSKIIAFDLDVDAQVNP